MFKNLSDVGIYILKVMFLFFYVCFVFLQKGDAVDVHSAVTHLATNSFMSAISSGFDE